MPAAGGRRSRRRVDGVLLVDKPVGRSSNAVLQHARHLFGAAKAGHTGTLDPLASGLLPVCFGEATKFAQSLLDARKAYVATVRFGVATTTGDAEGDVVAERPVTFARGELERTLERFVGVIEQLPPRHSALKFQGRSLYEYARAGIEVPRTPRRAEIDVLEILDWAPPDATLRVACGKGTYVRTLAEDIGAAVGSCAHLAALRRTATGPFGIENATTLEALADLGAAERDALLLPSWAPLADLPRLIVGPDAARALRQGRKAGAAGAAGGGAGRHACFEASGVFVGIVDVGPDGARAVRLVRTEAAMD